MSIPPFSPQIHVRNGATFYEDGRVTGLLTLGEKALCIEEWTSHFPGHGFTNDAIFWLRCDGGYTNITVNGIGSVVEDGEQSQSVSYWMHLHAKGKVETLLDDEGLDVTPILPEIDYEDEDEDLDEVGLLEVLGTESERLEKMATALVSFPKSVSSGGKARLRLSAYMLLRAFGNGELVSQKDLLEDSDVLYNLLEADQERYSMILKAIFGQSGDRSYESMLSLIRHTRGVGLVTLEKGWKTPLTYLFNPETQQVLSANGVMSVKDVVGRRKNSIIPPSEAVLLSKATKPMPDI